MKDHPVLVIPSGGLYGTEKIERFLKPLSTNMSNKAGLLSFLGSSMGMSFQCFQCLRKKMELIKE